jgi:hypothetical protein
MRGLGALYGVTLTVSGDEQDASKPAKKRTTRRRPSTATKTRTGAPTADANAGKSKQETAPRSAGSPSNADVRSWARQTGLTVSGRGRVPASVMTAYRSAHNK